MRWLRGETPDSSFERLRAAIQTSSLKTRLMIGLIPPVVLIMMITGYVTYLISKQSIEMLFSAPASCRRWRYAMILKAILKAAGRKLPTLHRNPLLPRHCIDLLQNKRFQAE